MKYINRFRAHSGHILYCLWPGEKTIYPSSVVLEHTNRSNLRYSMCWWDFREIPKNRAIVYNHTNKDDHRGFLKHYKALNILVIDLYPDFM